MSRPILLDAGPLVAYLSVRDQHHEWARDQWDSIDPPLLTCESVISEACFLLHRTRQGAQDVIALVARGPVEIAFDLQSEIQAVADLMQRYANVPMSLADACLVRMAELHPGSRVFTLDSDFRIYRKNRRQTIPTIMPDSSG